MYRLVLLGLVGLLLAGIACGEERAVSPPAEEAAEEVELAPGFLASDGCWSAAGLVINAAEEDFDEVDNSLLNPAVSPASDCDTPGADWRYRELPDGTFDFAVAVRCDDSRQGHQPCDQIRLFEESAVTTCVVNVDPFLDIVSFRRADCF